MRETSPRSPDLALPAIKIPLPAPAPQPAPLARTAQGASSHTYANLSKPQGRTVDEMVFVLPM